MKTILTVILILFVSTSQAQPTLEGLLLRLQIVENSTMTLPEFNRAMDSIAIKRGIFLKKDLQDWTNAVDRRMNDTVRARIKLVRDDVWKMDSIRTTYNAAVQDTNVYQLITLQNQIEELFRRIEAIKLRITNLKVTIQ